ncbi:MAG: cytochrome b/b6 domain-containing protein [Rhodocyclales bacterium]|nr:cytochrome b/b6 domain-containing protein [Rhodocyclales bacterium]
MQRFRVWDLPTRIFHWALVLCVIASFVTVNVGGNAMPWHGRIGLTVLGLLVFRMVWGFIGPTYARFAHFVKGPAAIKAYLRGQWHGAGHNPLGALSVLALLGTLALLAATGLFANDDIAFQGPLYPLVGKEVSDRLVGLHRLIEPLIMLLVFAHVAAIVFYTRVKKQDLVKPMITGWQAGSGEPAKGGGATAFCVALAIAVLAVYGAGGAWLPPAPPAPPAASGGGAPAF